jgi:hypothetical protein
MFLRSRPVIVALFHCCMYLGLQTCCSSSTYLRPCHYGRPGFAPRTLGVGFVLDELAVGQISCLKVSRFSPVIFSPFLHIHSSAGCRTLEPSWESVMQKSQEYETRWTLSPDVTYKHLRWEFSGKCLRRLETMMLQVFRFFFRRLFR